MSVEDANDVLASLRQAYRDEWAANHVLRTQLAEAAAFLDRMAARTVDFPGVVSDEGNELLVKWAADCRAMAKKLRGET